MSDLISRQAAIDAFMGEPTDAHYPSWYAEKIKELPPAQPDIIRCKDCKYYSNGECVSKEMWQNLYGETEVDYISRHPNDYCSYAERRTDE